MPLEIKANNWYRTRGGEIVYMFGVNPYPSKELASFFGTFKGGFGTSWFPDGTYIGGTPYDNDLVEHLPDCDGFDWVPKPKIKLEYGKKYVLANGEIVGPMECEKNHKLLRLYSSEPYGIYRFWSEDGVRCLEEARPTENIVAEYIEPEPTHEPWDFESMPVAVKVRNKKNNIKYLAFPCSVVVKLENGGTIKYNDFINDYTQLDGTPCGKRVQP